MLDAVRYQYGLLRSSLAPRTVLKYKIPYKIMVMRETLWEKIEKIRQEPEHIRRRYVYGCLVVSMAFVLGIWSLSLKESFRSVAKDVPQAVEKGKELIPQNNQASLSDLLEQERSLSTSGEELSGQEYFQEQLKQRAESQSPGMTEEGVDSGSVNDRTPTLELPSQGTFPERKEKVSSPEDQPMKEEAEDTNEYQ